MSLMTLFSTPKPFNDPLISTIQWNAIKSWLEFGDQVEVILIGEEEGVANVSESLGVKYLPDVKRNDQGTPLVSSIFELARQNSSSPHMCYINADIIVFDDLINTTNLISRVYEKFLIVGQRWDLNVVDRIKYTAGWQRQLQEELKKFGKLHPRGGSDYFVFPKACFEHIPEFAIGRAGWDNWMFYEARTNRWPLVDATESIQIIHQQHDYRHLPQGQPHYRLPESGENIKLAGGEIAIFDLQDTDRRVVNGKIRKPDPSLRKIFREVEISPLTILNSKPLGWAFYSLFHPKRGYWLLRKKLGAFFRK